MTADIPGEESMKRSIDALAISHSFALHIIGVAIEQGAKAGLPVAVTIVDPALALVAYLRADGITPHSVETSRRKAQTAASTRRATGYLQGELASALPAGTGNLLTNIKGGVPLRFDERLLGGLGIAGGAPDQDAEIARAVLAAIGADPVD